MANHGVLGAVGRDQRTEMTRTLWQLLSSRGILIAVGATVLILFLCATLIRQMPGQIADDPAAAARWLLTISADYGIIGGALRALGLFDVLHHPLLQLLLAVIALCLLVRLGNMVATLWRFGQVAQWFEGSVAGAGDPVGLPTSQPLYRLRLAISQPPQQLAEQLAQTLSPSFAEVVTTTVNPPAYRAETAIASLSLPAADEGATPAAASDPSTEFRLLARCYQQRWYWLRPIFLLGLLLALSAIWIILLAGWEVVPPLLAPGDEYRATTQRVALAYPVPAADAVLTAALAAEIDGVAYQLPLGDSRQLRLGQIVIAAQPGPPALLIRSADGATTLSRPGQAQHTADLGLIFPTLGSEDGVVVGNSVGLRIVRVAAPPVISPTEERTLSPVETPSGNSSETPAVPSAGAAGEQFWVEVYQSDEATPVETLHIQTETQTTLPVGDEIYALHFVPLPSIAAEVHYQPGIWLLWVALLCVIGGAFGFRDQPAFLIVQVAPWPVDRAVLIAQSDVAAEIDRIRRYLL
ncbi:MAG: hypothetical protein R3E79_01595 [Caldilineaceae bacterium]